MGFWSYRADEAHLRNLPISGGGCHRGWSALVPGARPMAWPPASPHLRIARDGLVLELSVRENMSLCALRRVHPAGKIGSQAEAPGSGDYVRLFNIRPRARIS